MKRFLPGMLIFFFSIFSLLPAQDEGNPQLFSSEEMLSVTIVTNMRTLLRDNDEDRDYHPATISVTTEGVEQDTVPVRLIQRGNFRRNNCQLPPLKLNFKGKDVAGTYFDHIDKIKLVLPCRFKGDTYDELLLKEYLMYRMYNHLTDSSFRVRLLEITFKDSAERMDDLVRYGFFIEPVDNLEARLGGEEVEKLGIHPHATYAHLTNLVSMYQFMVGNTDWSISGLHNVKMIRMDSLGLPLVIPYDFDWCGAVDAPYAQPNPQLNLNAVTQRLYRGFCRPEEEMRKATQRFLDNREAMYQEVNSLTLLEEKARKKLIRYLDEFYEILDSERKWEYYFMSTCRD